MNWCERCQPLVLDHLYGLLDGPDAAFVEAHLRECASCAATRDEAAHVAGLFAQAAQGAFPQVRFETPASEPAQLSEPAAPPRRRRRRVLDEAGASTTGCRGRSRPRCGWRFPVRSCPSSTSYIGLIGLKPTPIGR